MEIFYIFFPIFTILDIIKLIKSKSVKDVIVYIILTLIVFTLSIYYYLDIYRNGFIVVIYNILNKKV